MKQRPIKRHLDKVVYQVQLVSPQLKGTMKAEFKTYLNRFMKSTEQYHAALLPQTRVQILRRKSQGKIQKLIQRSKNF